MIYHPLKIISIRNWSGRLSWNSRFSLNLEGIRWTWNAFLWIQNALENIMSFLFLVQFFCMFAAVSCCKTAQNLKHSLWILEQIAIAPIMLQTSTAGWTRITERFNFAYQEMFEQKMFSSWFKFKPEMSGKKNLRNRYTLYPHFFHCIAVLWRGVIGFNWKNGSKYKF